MKFLVSCFYYVLLWLRGPVRVLTRLGSAVAFIAMIGSGLLYLAFPEPSRRQATGEMAVIACIVSLGLFLVGEGLDGLLNAMNRYRMRPV